LSFFFIKAAELEFPGGGGGWLGDRKKCCAMLTTATFAKTGLKNKIVQLQPAQYCMWCTSVQKDYLFEMEKQHSKFTYLGVFYKPINWRIYAHYYERLSDTYVHTIQRTFFVDWRVMGCSISHVMSAYEHIAEIHAISMHTCM
jgi:hypothetical protein